MDALIRIHAHRARVGEPECPARQHPVPQEAARETLAKLDLQGLGKPPLRYVEDKETYGDYTEDAQLKQEVPQVTPRQRIEKRLIPTIEADLSVGGGRDDKDQRSHQHRERLAHRGGENRTDDNQDF